MYVVHCEFFWNGFPPKNEWNALNAIWSRAFGPSIIRHLITHVLTICHVKLAQSAALYQKRFDLRSLSPALRNLRLLLVILSFFPLLVGNKLGRFAQSARRISKESYFSLTSQPQSCARDEYHFRPGNTHTKTARAAFGVSLATGSPHWTRDSSRIWRHV